MISAYVMMNLENMATTESIPELSKNYESEIKRWWFNNFSKGSRGWIILFIQVPCQLGLGLGPATINVVVVTVGVGLSIKLN